MAALIIGVGVAFFFICTVAILGFGLKNIEDERTNQARADENRVRTSRFFAVLRQDGVPTRVRVIDQPTMDRMREHLRQEEKAASEFVTNPSFDTLHRNVERRASVG